RDRDGAWRTAGGISNRYPGGVVGLLLRHPARYRKGARQVLEPRLDRGGGKRGLLRNGEGGADFMRRRFLAGVAAVVALGPVFTGAAADQKVVIQYDCIPNYANWGGVTAAYEKKTGVKVPPDMKGSSASMAALEAEKANPQADCVYYSGGIGYQAAQKGLHEPYKPKGFEKIPADLQDPNGNFWTVHTGHIATLGTAAAVKGKPIPRSFADLLKPEYKGLIVYDDPTIHGTGFTFVYGVNAVLGGGPDRQKGFEYLERLSANLQNVA